MLLIFVSVAWLAGIWAGPALPLPMEGAALVSISVFLLGLAWRRNRPLLLAGTCLAAILLGALRYQASAPAPPPLALYNGLSAVELRGSLSADPDQRDRTANLHLEVSALRMDGDWREAGGTVLVVAPRYPQYSYGDELRVAGKLEAPQRTGDFDYPGYLARQGIYSLMRFPRVQTLREGGGVSAWGWLLDARRSMADSLARVLPEPQASLAQGMLLGIRSSIPQELMDAFSRSGTAHIMVISGQNLTLLAGYVLGAGQPLLGRRRALWLCLGAITVYTLLVGAQPPVVRAVIMSSMFIIGAYLGRQRQAAIGLALSAALMAGFQPSILWDVSFQLSFAATAGLIFLGPGFQRTFQTLWQTAALRPAVITGGVRSYLIESLAVTLGATVAVLPLLLVNFHRVSLIAPAANLALLPALPGIMLSGALAAVLGSAPLVGQVAGWVAWPFLTYMTSAVEFLGGLSLASLEVPDFEIGLAVVYYSALCIGLLWRPRVGKASS